MFIELHIIQNFAPSNLNRDETNNPKDCMFGGTRRARISSQCLKRAIRHAPSFKQTVGDEIGIRTRLIAGELKKRFHQYGKEEAAAAFVGRLLAETYVAKPDKKKEKAADKENQPQKDKVDSERTSVLTYLSPQEIDYLANEVLQNWDVIGQQVYQDTPDTTALQEIVSALIKETKGRTSAADIALFGRMLADRPETSVDAACQVAHAISTHRVSMDIDFFTAVDDLQPGEETGAGMMGITGFNSATFYRYARLDWDQLVQNLYGQTDTAWLAVKGFLCASVEAIPTGKQNTFAAHNPPSFLLGVVHKNGMARSLANAFEKPVVGGSNGLVNPSVEALNVYWEKLAQVYAFDGRAVALALENGIVPPNSIKVVQNFEQWVKHIMDTVSAMAQE